MNFLAGFLMVLFIAFVLLFFALVAKVIDYLEERLKDGEDECDGEGDDGDDDDFWK